MDNESSDECTINLTRMYALQAVNYDISYFLCGPVLTAIVIAGLCGNFVCLLIFCRTILKPRIYLYLVALAVWDSLLLISSFLLYSLPVLLYGRVYIFGSYVPFYPLFYTFSNVTNTGSIWTVVVLAVERYFALCKPLKYITWDTEPRAKMLLSGVAAFAVLYHVPKYFEISILYCLETTGLYSVAVMDSSSLRENAVYKLFYKIMGGMMFFSVGPLLILIFLTVRVSMAIRENMKFQRKASSRKSTKETRRAPSPSESRSSKNSPSPAAKRKTENNEEKKMDLMLVAVMIKFCVCHTLPMVLDLCETLMSQFHIPFIELMVDISNVLVVADSSCNFAIYFIFGVKFRRNVKLICSGRYYGRSYYSSVKSYSSPDGSRKRIGSFKSGVDRTNFSLYHDPEPV